MKKILIIEDDRMMSRILQNHLAGNEIKFLLASEANEGIQKAEADNPDLIILDVALAGQSGIDILKKIKKMPLTASIPVIIFTAMDENDIIAEAKALGAADYIIKGAIPLEQILKRIKKFIE